MTTKDYMVNKQGAKIYSDVNKHEILSIPKIKNDREQGAIYEVLSVGMLGMDTPIVTVKEKGQAVAYRLPQQYVEWATSSLMMAKELNVSMFPEKVEFGCIEKENYYYAEML
ncbi:hypothetical protein IIO_06127 [Bacillus cereus VD115]|nr:hypothetical protein IIO_06127 [Bacillus cereus VD115]